MSSRLRYDAPDQRGARHEAARAVIEAVFRQKPEAIIELRDLPRHEAEGWDVMELDLCERFNARAPAAVGRIHVLSTLPSTASAPDEMFVGLERNFERPIVAVFVPPSVLMWTLKWNLSTPEFEITAVLMRYQWRRRPDAAASGTPLFSSLPDVLGDGGAKLLSEGFWNSAGLASPTINPILQSETEALDAVRRLYRSRAEFLEGSKGTGPMLPPLRRVPRRRARQLHDHADWLTRVQVCQVSPAQAAQAVGQPVQTVYLGIRRLAAFLNMELRPLPRTGRPAGAKDMVPGRRPRKNS